MDGLNVISSVMARSSQGGDENSENDDSCESVHFASFVTRNDFIHEEEARIRLRPNLPTALCFIPVGDGTAM